MGNPFATAAMAAGYATDRPPMHARVLTRVRDDLARSLPVRRALDVGCGAGLSTAPLARLAQQCLGVDPAEAMLASARSVAPGASFAVATAEHLPLRPDSVDLVTAAGSLNFTRVADALQEIRRVLTSQGVLVVYDWATGRELADGDELDEWFTAFDGRYPRPTSEAVPLDPDALERLAAGFRLDDAVTFAWPLPMKADAYARYMLTETRVAAAVRRGESLSEIAAWCHASLAEVFGGRTRDVLFRGYVAYLRPA